MGQEIIVVMHVARCQRIGAVIRSPTNRWTIRMSTRFSPMLTGLAGHAPINAMMGLSSSTVMREPRRSSGMRSGAVEGNRETDPSRFCLWCEPGQTIALQNCAKAVLNPEIMEVDNAADNLE